MAKAGPRVLKNSRKKDAAKALSTREPAPQLKHPVRAAINEAFQTDATVREAISENLRGRGSEAKAVTDRVRAAFATFDPSNLSTEERARRHYVAPDGNFSEAQDAVIEKGLKNLRSLKVKPSLTLHNSEELKTLITETAGGDGALAGSIKLESLINFITSKPDAAASPVYTRCKAEVDAQIMLDQVEGQTPKVNDKKREDTNTPRAPRAAEALVSESVTLQMETATSPETRLLYNVPDRANQAALQSNIDNFELRAGASDVTSYHDFSSLRIAFEHVWTQVFDGQLASLGQELYHEYVTLKEFSGNTDPDLKISTIDDLSRLMAEVRKLSQTVQDDAPSNLGGNSETNSLKRPRDFGDAVKGFLRIATLGGSGLIELALDELSKMGTGQPITWGDLPGPLPGNYGTIEYVVEGNVAPPNKVDIVLKTDPRSDWKGLELWLRNPATSGFSRSGKAIAAGDGQSVLMTVDGADVRTGALEFRSQETPLVNLSRYVLGRLGNKLTDRTRVTFYWKDRQLNP